MGIGQRIVAENENVRVQNLGKVGSPHISSTVEGVHVRGSTGFDMGSGAFDLDYYQANADWVRLPQGGAYDMTPIRASLNFSTVVQADEVAGFLFLVWDSRGNLITSGVDFIFGSETRALMGDEYVDMLESYDTDFISSVYNEPTQSISWSYPPIVGVAPNTFVVAVAGFNIDMDGNSRLMNYTMDWAFS